MFLSENDARLADMRSRGFAPMSAVEFSDDGTPRISERETLKAVQNAVTDGDAVKMVSVGNIDCNAKYSPSRKEIVVSEGVIDSLRSAFAKAKIGMPIEFEEEYAFETLHHERLHAMAKGWIRGSALNKESVALMESVNQLCSRYSYQETMKLFGLKPAHQEMILTNGRSYNNGVQNLRRLIAHSGIEEAEAVKKMRIMLVSGRYNDLNKRLADYLGVEQSILQRIDSRGEEFIPLLRR